MQMAGKKVRHLGFAIMGLRVLGKVAYKNLFLRQNYVSDEQSVFSLFWHI